MLFNPFDALGIDLNANYHVNTTLVDKKFRWFSRYCHPDHRRDQTQWPNFHHLSSAHAYLLENLDRAKTLFRNYPFTYIDKGKWDRESKLPEDYDRCEGCLMVVQADQLCEHLVADHDRCPECKVYCPKGRLDDHFQDPRYSHSYVLCPHCQILVRPESLSAHTRTHKCRICPEHFPNPDTVQTHMEDYHSCFEAHESNCGGKCAVCGKLICRQSSEDHLRKHGYFDCCTEVHQLEGETPHWLPCPLCDFRCCPRILWSHLWHCGSVTQCSDCPKEVADIPVHKQHFQTLHMPIRCGVDGCLAQLPKPALNAHQRTVHGWLGCEHCDTAEENDNELQIHTESAHSLKQPCAVCGSFEISIDNHLRTQHGFFDCPICQKPILRDELPDHIGDHNKQSKPGNEQQPKPVKPRAGSKTGRNYSNETVTCDSCSYSGGSRAALSAHKKVHSNQRRRREEVWKNRRCQCTYCGVGVCQGNLARHKRNCKSRPSN